MLLFQMFLITKIKKKKTFLKFIKDQGGTSYVLTFNFCKRKRKIMDTGEFQ